LQAEVAVSLERVFFPLRSNAGWWSSPDLKTQLEWRLKEALLLYDEVIIEDGTYTTNVLEHGRIEFYLPPGCLPAEQRRIEADRDLANGPMMFGISTAAGGPPQPVLQGSTLSRLKVDYYEFLTQLGSADFVSTYVPPDRLPTALQQAIDRSVERDERSIVIDEPHCGRERTLKALNLDLFTSIALKSAVVVDERHEAILAQKCLAPSDVAAREIPEAGVFTTLVAVCSPDFQSLTFAEVIDLRRDPAWQSFREALRRLTARIESAPNVLIDPDALRVAVSEALVNESLAALDRVAPSGRTLTIDLAMGIASLVPVVGGVATAASLARSLASRRESEHEWWAFLLKLRRA
jgi:hypothetical protein